MRASKRFQEKCERFSGSETRQNKKLEYFRDSKKIGNALVTGGSEGLGRALCEALIAEGYFVVNLNRDLQEKNDGTEHLVFDLSSRKSVDDALAVLASGQGFDVIIFNAGISASGKFEDISAPGHARIIAVNAEAPMVLCAGLMAAGKINRNAHIGFISSLSHFTGYPGAASYAASKDALAIYAKSIRKVWKNKAGIKVTTAFPGPLKTAHAARHSPGGADASRRMLPQEAARLILKDMKRGKSRSLPGQAARLFAFLGLVAPKPVTYVMKKTIYAKLNKTVVD